MSYQHLELFAPVSPSSRERHQPIKELGARHGQRRAAAVPTGGWHAPPVDAALLSSHHREHEMLDHEHEMQLHHLAPATDRMKRRSALLSSRPKALHLVPGAEGHPLLASDPLPPSTRS